MMLGKRKVDQLRTNIAKMARAAESGDKEEFKKASQNVPNLLEKSNIQSHIERLEVNGETKEEYFVKVLRTATPSDRIYEYLVFKRNLPERPEKMGVQVVAAGQEVFFAKILVDSHMAELLHGWMSSIAKT